ncbi:efflux RND transporter periplasmic adaptor subunit [Salinimicrobium sediminilitoris]|uniref:efflux RND transporter periplasmic adaptor subunit n=1 Tax=Salinimicrobium sediminilitoris TaxID=2876715 RepID=UPI001E5BB6DF|nr:efflux RND transporter periplasmic adaptor subunit [Salinimicrobium sediminilitoris]MCC8359795.1 efflux RND transporter periplasmic adaptor subunit [Salinimicrobium sediminilitoris]
MKKLSLIIVSLLILVSCGKNDSVEKVIESGDLSEIRAKKANLSAQQSELSSQIAQLDAAIEKLDSNNDFTLVSVRKITDSLFKHYVELPGDVETKQNITIYPEYSGILITVNVDEGDRVQKGQILARIDEGGLGSQLAQMEAQETLAKTTFERQQRLWEQNIGSEIQYLEARTNYEAIQNSVNQMRSQLAKTVVKAPFSGVIDEIFTEQGEVVVPGQSRLFRLINLSNMYITAAVPESYLGKIEVGTEVMVEIAATGTSFTSTVKQVGNFVNPNNRTFEIQVAVPQNTEQIKPNLIATVSINDYTSENAIIIPENVIQKNSAGENVAYVVKKETDSTGVAERRILETGLIYDSAVEVLSGLQPGDLLITSGARSIQEGEQVEMDNRNATN